MVSNVTFYLFGLGVLVLDSRNNQELNHSEDIWNSVRKPYLNAQTQGDSSRFPEGQ